VATCLHEEAVLNSLPVLFPGTVLASAAQKLDVRDKT